MFSGLPTAVAMALKSTVRDLFRPREPFIFRILRTEWSSRSLGNFARPHGLQHRLVGRAQVRRDDQQVVAGLERLNRGAANIIGKKMRQASHVERIGHDHALESQLLFEQVRNHRRRNRGDVVGIGIERRDGDVRHHHRVDARGDRLPKRRKFDRIQMRAVAVHAGDAQMRVGRGVAVAGKCFTVVSIPPSCAPLM